MMEEEADDVVFDSAQLIRKRTAGRPQSRDSMCQLPAQLRKYRAARTCCLCAAFLCLGLTASVTGPTLPYFKESLQVDVGKLSYMYAARCFGYLVGSVAGGVLFDQFGQVNDLLLGGGLLAGALGLAVAPFTTSLLLLCCALAVTGLANGFLYSGGVLVCSRQWGARRAPYLQALYFAISVGAFVAPLMSASFLGTSLNQSSASGLTDSVTSAIPNRPLALPKRMLRNAPDDGMVVVLPSLLPTQQSLVLPADVTTPRMDVAAQTLPVGTIQASVPYDVMVPGASAAPIGGARLPDTAASEGGERAHDASLALTTASHGPPVVHGGVLAPQDGATGAISTSGRPATMAPTTVTRPIVPETTAARPLKPKVTEGSHLSQDEKVAAGQDLGSRVMIAMKNSGSGNPEAAAPAAGAAQGHAPDPSPASRLDSSKDVTGTATGLPLNFSQPSGGRTPLLGSQANWTVEQEPTAHPDGLAWNASQTVDSSSSSLPSAGSSFESTTSWQNATDGTGTAGNPITTATDADALSTVTSASLVDLAVTSQHSVALSAGVGISTAAAANDFSNISTTSSAALHTGVVNSGQSPDSNGTDASVPSSVVTATVVAVNAPSNDVADNGTAGHAPLFVSAATGNGSGASVGSGSNGKGMDASPAHDRPTVLPATDIYATTNTAVAGLGMLTDLPVISATAYNHSSRAPSPPPATQSASPQSQLVGTGAAASIPGSTADTIPGQPPTSEVTVPATPDNSSNGDIPTGRLPDDQASRGNATSAATSVSSPTSDSDTNTAVVPSQPQPATLQRSTVASPLVAIVDRHTYSPRLDDVQIIYLMLSAFLVLVALCFLLMSLSDRSRGTRAAAKCSATVGGSDDDGLPISEVAAEAALQLPMVAGGSVRFMSRMLALVFIVCMLYVGVEVTFGQFLATYSARLASFTERQASLLTAGFWGLFVLGRGLSVLAARCVSPAALLSSGLSLSCVALLVLSFATGTASGGGQSVLWIGTGLLGAGLAPIFPTSFAWTQQYVDVSGKVASVLVGGSSLGGMILPVVVGHLLERLDPAYMMYVLLGAVTVCSFVYALAWYVAAVASAPDGRLCTGVGGLGGGGSRGYEAVSTDARPVDDDYGGGVGPQSPTGSRLMSKRNTGHKRVSFRLLDDTCDKDI